MKKVALILVFFSLYLFGQGQEMPNDQRYKLLDKPLHPYNPTTKLTKNKNLRDNEYILDLGNNPQKVIKVKKALDRYKKLMDGTYNLDIAGYSKEVPMRDIIFVEPFYKFTSKVIFPIGYVISLATASDTSKIVQLHWDENILQFQSSKDFEVGNIDVFITNGVENISTTIVLKQFNPLKGEAFVPVTKVTDRKNIEVAYHISDWDVISKYKELHGSLDFEEYGVIYIDGKAYYIIADENNGRLIYRGRKYRVSKSLGRR